MPELNTYILFNGDCAAAMRFYERVLGGQIEELITVGESPMASQFPPSSANRIINARLLFDGNTLMGSDWMLPTPHPGVSGVRLMLTFEDEQEASRIFAELAEAGRIDIPLWKTAWSRAFGQVVDRYGIPWQIMVV
jgi:PhnB protein